MTDPLGLSLVDCCTALAGRWPWFDGLVALPMRNDLVKSAVVCGSFVAAWHAARTPREIVRTRSILFIALAAALTSLAASVCMSNKFVAPRPYVYAQQVYRLEQAQLVAQPKHELRTPLDGGSRQRLARLDKLDIPPNDFGSFPSDHASLFLPMAVGVWIACRRLGALALVWTIAFIIFPKLHLGLHSPLDIAAGSLLGLGTLSILMGIRGLLKPLRHGLNRLCLATERQPAMASSLLFVAMYELCSKFEHVEALLASAKRFL